MQIEQNERFFKNPRVAKSKGTNSSEQALRNFVSERSED